MNGHASIIHSELTRRARTKKRHFSRIGTTARRGPGGRALLLNETILVCYFRVESANNED
jgi:hypothetical protein